MAAIPGDGALSIIRRHHHQVCQFVDDHHDIGHRRQIGVEDTVVIDDVAGAGLTEFVVARVHLGRHPAQYADGSLQLDHHRRHQVGHAVIACQFDALGVDHDELYGIGRIAGNNAVDDGVDANRLARASGAGDEQVRHCVKSPEIGLPSAETPSAIASGDSIFR